MFVLVADALPLFEAAGLGTTPVNTVGPTQAEYNRWAAAMLLTCFQVFREYGTVPVPDLEKKLAANGSMVDQFSAEETRKQIMAIGGMPADMLDRLYPANNS